MHIKTSTHILSLAEDHIYNLRKIGVLGDDSWLEARKGEAYNRHLQVKLADNALHLSFEGSAIGSVPIANAAQVKSIIDFVQYWNLNVGPTDVLTTKTIELVRDWPQLLEERELRVRCVTWNCAGLLGEQGLKVETWMRLIGSEQTAVQNDVIVLAFQETDNLNRSVKSNPITLQRCADLSSRYVYKSHKLVSSVQLLGLMTLTFVRHELVPFVSNVRTDTSSTGLLRMWGNKGAVLTRLYLLRDEILGGGLQLSIVNCHLSAGEGVTQVGRRRWELKEISSKFDVLGLAGKKKSLDEPARDTDADSISSVSEDESEIKPSPETAPSDDIADQPQIPISPAEVPKPPAEAPRIQASEPPGSGGPERSPKGHIETASETVTLKPSLSESELSRDSSEEIRMEPSQYVIVMGDLNYRVLMPESEAQKKVKKQHWDGLLARESLILERQRGEVFGGFEEAAIAFPPTYKYEIGSTKFRNRVPSYTDRILFRTLCPHSVENYVSLTDLKSSDHRPVALTTRLTVPNVVGKEKRLNVMSRAMKLADDAENNVRPKLSVDVQQVTLKGPPLSLQAQYIVIRNDGMRPVQWVVENAQDQISDQSNEEVSQEKTAASERERDIERDHVNKAENSLSEVNQVSVTPPMGEVSLNRPTSSVKIEARIDILARDYILLVKPEGDYEGGIHKYVFVHIEPTRSYLGATLKAMPQTGGIPDPVRKCVEFLWDKQVSDMFLRRVDPVVFQRVLHWVDNDEPFDLEVLQAADKFSPEASVYAVSHVLMALFKYLPDQLMGPGPKRKGATKDWAGVTNYVCRFISHAAKNEYEDDILNVWANLLYDRNDKRAGANEKRAYLRSMLIIAEQRPKPKSGRETAESTPVAGSPQSSSSLETAPAGQSRASTLTDPEANRPDDGSVLATEPVPSKEQAADPTSPPQAKAVGPEPEFKDAPTSVPLKEN